MCAASLAFAAPNTAIKALGQDLKSFSPASITAHQGAEKKETVVIVLPQARITDTIYTAVIKGACMRLWLDRPRQNRQGFHRYLVRLCLAVRGQWFDHAQAPPAGARGVAGAGRAGLDGNRVRGGQVRHHPAQGGRLTPPHSIVNKTFLSFIFNGLFSC